MQRPRTTVSIIAWSLGLPMTSSQPTFIATAEADTAATMTIEQTQAAFEAYLDALLAQHAGEDCFAEEITVTFVETGEVFKGPNAAQRALRRLDPKQFDAELEIRQVMVGAGLVAYEAKFVGAQTAKATAAAPNGRRVDLLYSVFGEVYAGKMSALRVHGLADVLRAKRACSPGKERHKP
jgi:hypothetical protein